MCLFILKQKLKQIKWLEIIEHINNFIISQSLPFLVLGFMTAREQNRRCLNKIILKGEKNKLILLTWNLDNSTVKSKHILMAIFLFFQLQLPEIRGTKG